jgi:hypothetical protein
MTRHTLTLQLRRRVESPSAPLARCAYSPSASSTLDRNADVYSHSGLGRWEGAKIAVGGRLKHVAASPMRRLDFETGAGGPGYTCDPFLLDHTLLLA